MFMGATVGAVGDQLMGACVATGATVAAGAAGGLGACETERLQKGLKRGDFLK